MSRVDQPHFEVCDLEEGAGTFLTVQLETSEAFDEASHHHGVEQTKINRSLNFSMKYLSYSTFLLKLLT